MPRAQDRHASTHCRSHHAFLSLFSLFSLFSNNALSSLLFLRCFSLSLYKRLSFSLSLIIFPLSVSLSLSFLLSLSLFLSLLCSLSGNELFEIQPLRYGSLGRALSLSFGLSFPLSLSLRSSRRVVGAKPRTLFSLSLCISNLFLRHTPFSLSRWKRTATWVIRARARSFSRARALLSLSLSLFWFYGSYQHWSKKKEKKSRFSFFSSKLFSRSFSLLSLSLGELLRGSLGRSFARSLRYSLFFFSFHFSLFVLFLCSTKPDPLPTSHPSLSFPVFLSPPSLLLSLF